jgi:hypothetical protein
VNTGLRLLKKRDRAFRMARILFALQIPNFTLGGISYFFATGAYFLVNMGNVHGGGIHFDIGTRMYLVLGGDSNAVGIGVNLLALAAFFYLGRLKADSEEVKPEDIFPTVKSPTAGRPRQTRLPDDLP